MVRVRFAPSPTGYLHLGNVRIAVINYAFSLSKNGTFILRIDDTDLKRSDENFTHSIVEDLKWLGIEFEGPVFQSSRLQRYREIAEEFLKKGYAYRCFCTQEEIDEMRKKQLENKLPPRYDGRCRNKSQKEINMFLDKSVPFTLRIKIDEKVSFVDMKRGAFEFEEKDLEDFIILKSDGLPTYNFACAVDDVDMKITHVIRGEDHIPNTPKQVYIMNLLKAQPPVYYHLPLIVNANGEPLSKRESSLTLRELRKDGFLPEAIISYLLNLGWNRLENRAVSFEEVKEEFNIEEFSSSRVVFDPSALRRYNSISIKKKIGDENFIEYFRNYLKSEGINVSLEGERLQMFLDMVKDNIRTLKESIKFFGIIDESLCKYEDIEKEEMEKAREVAKRVLEDFKDNFNIDDLSRVMSLKKSEVLMYLRIALSGLKSGPPLSEIIRFLGDSWKERIFRFIGSAGKEN